MNHRWNSATVWAAAIVMLAVLAISPLCGCQGFRAADKVKKYRGDGVLRFLKGPLLGSSGWAVRMPALDMSIPSSAEYDLGGIPQAVNYYIVYLIVPDPCPMTEILKGTCVVQIKKNGAVVKSKSGSISEMTNTHGWQNGNKLNRFYYFDDRSTGFYVTDTTSKWSVAVSCSNANLKVSVPAYVEIRAGGYK
jgi:hypothetical protein